MNGYDISIVKSGIEAIISRKRKNGVKYPVVEPQIILFDHLMHEKELIENYLDEVGVDSSVWKEDSWGFNPSSKKGGVNKTDRSSVCFWLYLGLMVRPDGNVYPCCGRGFDRLAYGNLLNESIEEIWNNKYYQFSRKLFQSGPPLEYRAEMEGLPCHKCELFKKKREMLPD